MQKILIVGLGNPGKKYEKTRHNAGFLAIDALREQLHFPEWSEKKKEEALLSAQTINSDTEVILVKPQTFMNLSGKAVISLKKAYNIANENLWCIYDDIDLPLGTIRIRKEGSAGTHNGMRSIVASLSSQEFPRIRIGIETRKTREEKALDEFVLGRPSGEEKKTFLEICTKFVPEAMQKAIEEGFPITVIKVKNHLPKQALISKV